MRQLVTTLCVIASVNVAAASTNENTAKLRAQLESDVAPHSGAVALSTGPASTVHQFELDYLQVANATQTRWLFGTDQYLPAPPPPLQANNLVVFDAGW